MTEEDVDEILRMYGFLETDGDPDWETFYEVIIILFFYKVRLG